MISSENFYELDSLNERTHLTELQDSIIPEYIERVQAIDNIYKYGIVGFITCGLCIGTGVTLLVNSGTNDTMLLAGKIIFGIGLASIPASCLISLAVIKAEVII